MNWHLKVKRNSYGQKEQDRMLDKTTDWTINDRLTDKHWMINWNDKTIDRTNGLNKWAIDWTIKQKIEW